MITLAITQDDFINRVELLVRQDKLRYTEAICQICEEHSIDIEDIAPLVTKQIRDKIVLQNSKDSVSTLF
jgi:hypothetical protein